MMNWKRNFPALALIFSLSVLSQATQAGIKCWWNHIDEIKECGNVVPPEFAQQGHEEISEQGITVSTTEPAKTTEEIALEKEAKRQQEEREQLAEQRAIEDQNLLDTFTTEEDLILARDGKLRVLDSRIAHQERIKEDLNGDLRKLEEEAADQERPGQPVSEDLLARIADVQAKIQESQGFIGQREQERVALREKFDADLLRYRQLKGN